MILKASQRGGGSQLAAHLLKAENEHVEVHDIRGFVSNNVKGAMKEAQAVAAGTRCKQYLFSVSLNPPETEAVEISKFETALDRIEAATGLTGQPRIVVFHEKEGRRHCHAVWSRIDADKMTAIPLPHFKNKLREISKDLYLEHGWQMPRGFLDSKARDPLSFTLAEWQAAKRAGRDPRQLKALIRDCWAVSDTRPAFAQALEERGLYLAQGDRRAHVAVTFEGEVVSIARATGLKTKDVALRLDAPDNAPSVADTRKRIAETIAPRLSGLIREAKSAHRRELEPLNVLRADMTAQHKLERQRLMEGQKTREDAEAKIRLGRFRRGIAGAWDRLSGRHAATRQQNDREALQSFRRDRSQRDGLVHDQLKDRRGLQFAIRNVRHKHAMVVLGLYRDLAHQRGMFAERRETLSREFNGNRLNRASLPTGRSLRTDVRDRGKKRNSVDFGR